MLLDTICRSKLNAPEGFHTAHSCHALTSLWCMLRNTPKQFYGPSLQGALSGFAPSLRSHMSATPDIVACTHTGAASTDAETSYHADPPPAQQLAHTKASPTTLSSDQIRQLAPAGPAQDSSSPPQSKEPLQPTPLASCERPTAMAVNVDACSTAQAASVDQMHHPSQQAEGPVVPQVCSRLVAAAPSARTSPLAVPVSEATQQMPGGSQQQGQQQLVQRITSPPTALQKQAVQGQVGYEVAASQLPCAGAVPPQAATASGHARPDAVLHGVADAVLPAPCRATPPAQTAEAPVRRALSRGQAAEAAPQQGLQATPSRGHPRGQAAEAAAQQAPLSRALSRGQAAEAAPQQGSQATPSRAPARGPAAEAAAQQGSHARHAEAVATSSRSSKNLLRDRNTCGTRMSLRSRNPAPDKAISKASSSSRSGHVRSASDVRAPAYATRCESRLTLELTLVDLRSYITYLVLHTNLEILVCNTDPRFKVEHTGTPHHMRV